MSGAAAPEVRLEIREGAVLGVKCWEARCQSCGWRSTLRTRHGDALRDAKTHGAWHFAEEAAAVAVGQARKADNCGRMAAEGGGR